MESANGDYLLSPAYDLLNTRLYMDDSDFALDRGLFAYEFQSEVLKRTAHPGLVDFMEFGTRINISEKRIEKLLALFRERQDRVGELINQSFLNEASKRAYLLDYDTKRNLLNT